MGWKQSGIRDSTHGNASASFRHGKTTSITMPNDSSDELP
jgi:hypothetical protein